MRPMLLLFTVLVAVVAAGFLAEDNRTLSAELAAMKHDRAEVARIEAFIEKQVPHIHPATRRGFAELTVETRWPIPND